MASAFDNDDIFFRVATLVQMFGVLLLALGLPPLFESINEGEHINNAVMVAGYVVMRVSGLALWLRIARQNPKYRAMALTYVWTLGVAQLGWVGLIFLNLPLVPTMIAALALTLIEMAGPTLAERRVPSPWHPHHIAERYGLLVIITLGEIVLGTLLTTSEAVDESGWTWKTILLGFAGVSLAFALWWSYFTVPSGWALAKFRSRAFVWGYGHIVLFGSLVGIGTGLHVAANVLSGHAEVDEGFAVLWVAVPLLVFEVSLFALYSMLLSRFDIHHIWHFLGAFAVLVLGVLVVLVGGASIAVGLAILACSPVVIVVAYETIGHKHQEEALRAIGA